MRLILLVLSLVIFCSPSVQSFAASSFTCSALVSAADIMSEEDHLNNKVDVNEASENLAPWSERWKKSHIAFHLKDVNPIIEKYAPQYLVNKETSAISAATAGTDNEDNKSCDANIPNDIDGINHNKRVKSAKRAFVPLCGKTIDLAYLTTIADEVVGVEGIRMALEQFAEEQPQLNISTESTITTDGFERFVGDKITLLKGDYFELDASKTGGQFDLIFDRGSTVAIEPKMRQAYVDVLESLLAPGGTILLVVLERIGTEEGMKMGPPYSIPEATVRELYEDRDWVESVKFLEQSDQLETKPEDRERFPDLDHLFETVYEIKRKG